MPCEPVQAGCFEITREVHLAETELPALGAFTAQDFYTFPAIAGFGSSVQGITFYVTYTRGGADGAPVFRLEVTNGTEEARQLIQDDGSLVTAQPEGTVNVLQENLAGPIPADDNPLVYHLPWKRAYGTTGVRLLVAEVGNTAAPGTCEITLTGSGAC